MAAGDNDGNYYLWAAMGSAATVGFGLAMAQPSRPVLVLTGDGEMLMGLGALASRAAVRGPLYGLATLVSGVVGAFVFGVKPSAVPWLVPPVLAAARASTSGASGGTLALLTGRRPEE